MRPSHFLFFFFLPSLAFGAACNSSDVLSPPGTPCDSLTVNTPVVFPPNTTAGAIELTVNGDVFINADIILDGTDGLHITADNTYDYISGGPGASEGGGFFSLSSLPGIEASIPASDPSDGGTASSSFSVCNPGGGGGGFYTPGTDGVPCSADLTNFGAGGPVTTFPSPFRGGFGGGAGGPYEVVASTVYDIGSGGGGGGALHINATGKITIKNGVLISARGGRGGNSVDLGGAGGGGSGGVIWLQSPFPISNQGIIDVSGGAGGVNTKAASPKGSNGGKGGDGIFRAEVAGVPSDSTGRSVYTKASPNLKSSISCGTVAGKNSEQNLFTQMSFGFLIICILRILFRYQKKV